jgi:hypothetical protein
VAPGFWAGGFEACAHKPLPVLWQTTMAKSAITTGGKINANRFQFCRKGVLRVITDLLQLHF